MVSQENTNWLFDYGLIDDIPVPDGNFQLHGSGFSWSQALNGSSNASVKVDGSFGDSDGAKENSKKRVRAESCGATSSKACREKLRRDRLNDKCSLTLSTLSAPFSSLPLLKGTGKANFLSTGWLSLNMLNIFFLPHMMTRFLELGAILEPGRPPKTDKAAMLVEAIRMVTHLRGEAQKLKDSNSSLQEKIKELKAEKNELRDEKQRLKVEKEKLEQQLKSVNAQPTFLPQPPAIPAAFAAPQGQAPGGKLVPFISYPGVAMWQFMPPAAVDTSQDHVLHPPVA